MAEVPLSHLPKAVYMTSMEWISGCSTQAAESFFAWALDTVLDDLATPPDYESSQAGGCRTQVGVFSVLAMVLRQKPNALINVLQWKMDKYQVQDGCLVIAWMIVQASRGKLCVGLYLWARHILPLVEQSAGSNPQTMDLIAGLIKWILNTPGNRSMLLLEETIENGERLVPLSALDILLRVAFPASSLDNNVTKILRGAYPSLKRVALEGFPGTPEAMKQVSKELLPLALKAAGKGIPRVSEEATMLVNWCLIKNTDCYKIWNTLYMDNIEASALVLRDLVIEWSILSVRQSSVDALRETLNSFRLKNKISLDVRVDAHQAHYRDADESCKILLARLSRGHELQQWIFYLLAFVVGMIIGCYMFCTVGTSCDHCSSITQVRGHVISSNLTQKIGAGAAGIGSNVDYFPV